MPNSHCYQCSGSGVVFCDEENHHEPCDCCNPGGKLHPSPEDMAWNCTCFVPSDEFESDLLRDALDNDDFDDAWLIWEFAIGSILDRSREQVLLANAEEENRAVDEAWAETHDTPLRDWSETEDHQPHPDCEPTLRAVVADIAWHDETGFTLVTHDGDDFEEHQPHPDCESTLHAIRAVQPPF